jgi:adenine-specific DNA-methyltransferase
MQMSAEPYKRVSIQKRFHREQDIVLHEGDCVDLLRSLPDKSIQLIVTSPPYNIGKAYEKKTNLSAYTAQQKIVIEECCRALKPGGSICWQVGNFIDDGAIVPLDIVLYPIFSDLGLKMRNRIIWHFEHGLHCSKRLSGRYETIIWFTKGDDYCFDLDPIRVPQKYPGKKYFKGPKAGQYSCNPLGKNPGDVWVIPNVKSNHVEKTDHPCQFPIELVERLVLSLTKPGDWVLDPYAGVGSTIVASILNRRKAAGAEISPAYAATARERIQLCLKGILPRRVMHTPVFDPAKAGKNLTEAPWLETGAYAAQLRLLEEPKEYKTRTRRK